MLETQFPCTGKHSVNQLDNFEVRYVIFNLFFFLQFQQFETCIFILPFISSFSCIVAIVFWQ